MTVQTNLSLQHVVRPANKANAPLLLLLHGYGSDENDLFSFAPEISEDYFIVSARAPFDMQPYGAAWYAINFDATGGKFSDENQARESMDRIMLFLKEIEENYPINRADINLLGFSQGAILSFALSMSYPQVFNKVIAMSGYINEDLVANMDQLKHAVSKPKYFISHGTMDQVVPYEWAIKSPAIMEKNVLEYVFKDYPIGHGVARDNFYDMKTWLESK